MSHGFVRTFWLKCITRPSKKTYYNFIKTNIQEIRSKTIIRYCITKKTNKKEKLRKKTHFLSSESILYFLCAQMSELHILFVVRSMNFNYQLKGSFLFFLKLCLFYIKKFLFFSNF